MIFDEATVALERLSCGECGIVFAAPAYWVKQRRESGGTFSCPNGHGRAFRKSAADRLREELASKTAEAVRLRQRVTAAERQAKRYKCTACPRDFATAQNLETHVRKTHKQPLKLAAKAGPDAHNRDASLKAVP